MKSRHLSQIPGSQRDEDSKGEEEYPTNFVSGLRGTQGVYGSLR